MEASLWLAADPAGRRADLSGASLVGADLSEANLSDLSRADLSGADAYESGRQLALRTVAVPTVQLHGVGTVQFDRLYAKTETAVKILRLLQADADSQKE